MELTQLIVLAVLHSLSEIFPLGADGHYVLASHVLDWQAVRSDRWKYIHYPKMPEYDELYDLQARVFLADLTDVS